MLPGGIGHVKPEDVEDLLAPRTNSRRHIDIRAYCGKYGGMLLEAETSFHAAFAVLLPTRADLDKLLALETWHRECVPMDEDRLAAPFIFTWQDGNLVGAQFEIYDPETPLGKISAHVYRTFLNRPEVATVRHLHLGNVACNEFRNSQLLGDPIALLARAGLPPNLERLELARLGPISNAGDLGFYSSNPLTPLLPKLGNVVELDIAGCDGLGKLDLPRLRSLRLHHEVSIKNIKELSQAKWPALERLELEHDSYDTVENRFKSVRTLLRAKNLPRLSYLVLDNLDLDEDQRLELDDDEEAEAEPDSWVDMIADAPLLRQLRGLELSFREDDRELQQLVTRAEAFQHLEVLEFWGGRGRAKLEHPTRASIQAALER